jgi:hypothetical protein
MADAPSDLAEKPRIVLTLPKLIWCVAWLAGQGTAALTLAVLGAQVDTFHRLSMGPLYLALAWTCLWLMVAVGWMLLSYAYWTAMVGLLELDRQRAALMVSVVGGTIWVCLTAFIIGVIRTFIGSV